MGNNKHICKFCGKEFETAVKLGGHVSRCKENPKYKETINKIQQTRQDNLNINNPIEEHICKCQYCGNDYRVNLRHNAFVKGLYNKTCSIECAHKLSAQHTNLEEKNKNIGNSLKGKPTWIKGMKRIIGENNINNKWTKDPNYKPYKICPICNKEFYNKKHKYCSEECKKIGRHKKLSDLARNNNFGGYEPNSIKNHHHGNYKGIHYDSSWELAYLVWNIEHNIDIKRCNEVRTYITEDNKIHKYFPDFIVNNEIIEIKGYFGKGAQLKAAQNPDIHILKYEDLKDIIQYVINKYGNKYWEILDDNAV